MSIFEYVMIPEFEWSLLLFIFLVAYAVAMYLMCVVLMPTDLDQVAEFRPYFFSLRRWFFGGLVALILIDLADKGSKGLDHLLDIGFGYMPTRTFLLVGSIVAMRTDRRTFNGPFAAVSFIVR